MHHKQQQGCDHKWKTDRRKHLRRQIIHQPGADLACPLRIAARAGAGDSRQGTDHPAGHQPLQQAGPCGHGSAFTHRRQQGVGRGGIVDIAPQHLQDVAFFLDFMLRTYAHGPQRRQWRTPAIDRMHQEEGLHGQ